MKKAKAISSLVLVSSVVGVIYAVIASDTSLGMLFTWTGVVSFVTFVIARVLE